MWSPYSPPLLYKKFLAHTSLSKIKTTIGLNPKNTCTNNVPHKFFGFSKKFCNLPVVVSEYLYIKTTIDAKSFMAIIEVKKLNINFAPKNLPIIPSK